MALPNRFGRRNAGNASGNVIARRNPGSSALDARMSRSGFLRTAGAVGGALAAAGLGMGGLARAEHGPSDYLSPELIAGGGNNYNVWPSGDPATDVQNIQWAVDNVREGGFVRLKAHDKFTGEPKAFNLGNELINITRDVVIEGVPDLDGSGNVINWHTVIKNGTFRVGSDGEKFPVAPGTPISSVEGMLTVGAPAYWHPRVNGVQQYGLNPCAAVGFRFYRAYFPHFTCRYIQFDESRRAAMIIGAASGLDITHNRINGTRFYQANLWIRGKQPVRNTYGIIGLGPFVAPFYGLQQAWDVVLSNYNGLYAAAGLPPLPVGTKFKDLNPQGLAFPNPPIPAFPYLQIYLLAYGLAPTFQSITGNVDISDNVINDVGVYQDYEIDPECTSNPVYESATSGIFFGFSNANATFAGNEVVNVHRFDQPIDPLTQFSASGFRLMDNKTAGTILQGNYVENAAFEGIRILHTFFPGNYNISDNEVVVNSMAGSGISIESFKLVLPPNPNGYSVLANNTISGDGQIGIFINSSSNTINISSGNLNGFIPAVAHVKLTSASNSNKVYGTTGLSVIDEDSNEIYP